MNGTRNNTVSFIDTYNKLMQFKKIGKARRKAQERAQKPAPGLTTEQRADRYRRQTGARELTPRQAARLAKKHHGAVGRALATTAVAG